MIATADNWKSRYAGGLESAKIIKREGRELVTLGHSADVVKVEGSDESPTITYRYTDNSFDLANDRFDMQGQDTSLFERNPVCPWSHMSWMPPVGTGSNVRIVANTRLLDIRYHGIGAFAQEIRDMAVARVIKAVSQGCIVDEFEEEDAAEFVKSGLASPLYDTVRTYTKTRLLEVSPCTIPMLPTALAQDDDPEAKSFEAIVRRSISDGIIPSDGEVASYLSRITDRGIEKFLEHPNRKKLAEATQHKAGRKIAGARLEKLKQGHGLIGEAIAEAEAENEQSTEGDKSMAEDPNKKQKADTPPPDGGGSTSEPTIQDVLDRLDQIEAKIDAAQAEDDAEDQQEEQDDATKEAAFELTEEEMDELEEGLV